MDTTAVRLSGRQWWLLAVGCMGVALVIAAMAALYTALPEIAADTGATQQQLTWIIDGYTLMLACLVLPCGALGDRYGRRLVLVLGLVVFSLASALPLALNSPTWLIVARAFAGVGAALVMPSTLSLLTANFPESRRSAAIATWAGVAGVSAVIGFLGSGLLLEFFSWLSIFVGMAAAGAVLAVAGCTVVDSVDDSRPAMDPLGTVCSAAAVGLLVIGAIEAPVRGWTDPLTLFALVGAVLAGVGFVFVELRVRRPLLDVRLFAVRGFGAGSVAVGMQFLAAFGTFLLIMQFMQLFLGYSALKSAVALAPMIVPMIALAMAAPYLAERYGLRLPTLTGVGMIGIALLGLSRLTPESDYLDLLWPLLVMSSGLGLSSPPATAAIIANTPAAKHGVASAVNDAAREVGAAVGIAIAGSVLAAGYTERIAPILPQLPEQAREPVGGSLAAAVQVAEQAGPQADPLVDAAQSAFMHGASNAALALGVVTLVAAALLGLWAPGRSATPAVLRPEEAARGGTPSDEVSAVEEAAVRRRTGSDGSKKATHA
ncbi:MFS transporter [Nocardia higoensis]|uniref:MFS transporter n=1 Tax=Nocardia higoensis TaxID=228599 RepID=A0ABS0D762_9NOCA|nr:MFS transporter [Nocardia higoensis]MBF6354319.1 MFS transporter [Nocardia higoensis]